MKKKKIANIKQPFFKRYASFFAGLFYFLMGCAIYKVLEYFKVI